MYMCTSPRSVQWASLGLVFFLLILVTPEEIIPSCSMRLMIMNRSASSLLPGFVEQGKGHLGFQIGRRLCEYLFQKKKMLFIYVYAIYIYISMRNMSYNGSAQ